MTAILNRLDTEIKEKHHPFITYDIEITGITNGRNDRITQISLVAYNYNKQAGKYELQDQLFMLAKPDKQAIRAIQEGEKVTKENIERRLAQDYAYSFVKNKESEIQKLEKKLTHDENYPKRHSQKELDDLRERIALEKDSLAIAVSVYKTRKEMLDSGVSIDEIFSMPIVDATISPQVLDDCRNYIAKHYESKKLEMEKAPLLKDILKSQGLDLETYIKENKGLTAGEMQTGITAFLDKYRTDNTVFISDGYFSKYYMEKVGLSMHLDNPDKIINLVEASSWRNGRWIFVLDYRPETWKDIKTFDALTKALGSGEMTANYTGLGTSLTSKNYLDQKVKEETVSKDNHYVMSLFRASQIEWFPDYSDHYNDADYCFNRLEYVDFGNDRRYVDIDKMFAMNNNFEITLEGEKEPIKTWEELESKIKALNSDISKELLNKIHEKYDEITKKTDINQTLKQQLEEEQMTSDELDEIE